MNITSTCPVANPPLELGSGALDQLIDALLMKLLSSESRIRINKSISLSNLIEVKSLTVSSLHSISRTCSAKLTSKDALGCHQHGLVLDMCFGFDHIPLNVSVKTGIFGLKEGVSGLTDLYTFL